MDHSFRQMSLVPTSKIVALKTVQVHHHSHEPIENSVKTEAY